MQTRELTMEAFIPKLNFQTLLLDIESLNFITLQKSVDVSKQFKEEYDLI